MSLWRQIIFKLPQRILSYLNKYISLFLHHKGKSFSLQGNFYWDASYISTLYLNCTYSYNSINHFSYLRYVDVESKAKEKLSTFPKFITIVRSIITWLQKQIMLITNNFKYILRIYYVYGKVEYLELHNVRPRTSFEYIIIVKRTYHFPPRRAGEVAVKK